MGVVEKILKRNQKTITIDGVDIVIRRLSALDLMGRLEDPSGVLSAVEAGVMPSTPELSTTSARLAEVSAGICRDGVVSPKVCDVTDHDNDMVSVADFGDLVEQVAQKIMEFSGLELAKDFPESSQGQEETT